VIWLLDACVLLRAEDAGRLSELLAAASLVRCAVVREVYDEVTAPETRKQKVLERARKAKAEIDKSSIEVRNIPLLSDAATRMAAFRDGRTTANDAGEAASVALASTDTELVFVTAEKGAVWLGIREAYPHTTVLPWFLRALVEGGAMPWTVADEIVKADSTPLPSWWAEWSLRQRPTP
jgi:hypothetical protein